MFKITRIKDDKPIDKHFHVRTINNLDYCSIFLTFFGKTFLIRYSSKFNYFYISRQVRRNRLLIDALALSFIRQLILKETQKTLTQLKQISTIGNSADYYLDGILDGERVFIKVNLSRIQPDEEANEVMKNEYDKGLLLSKDCPYILKPLHYISSLPCEIIIFPYIYNMKTLEDILINDNPVPLYIKEQLQYLITFLKSKKLVHRDMGGHNICIGNINDAPIQLFLTDLASMTYLDDNGNPLPISMENLVRKNFPNCKDEDEILEHLLHRIDQKTSAE